METNMTEQQNKTAIDVDKAWSALHARLQQERLITPAGRPVFIRSTLKRVAILLLLVAGAAAGIYLNEKPDASPAQVISNRETNASLVTTLTDGTVVYLADGATLNCPAAFENANREVSLYGEAMFEVKSDKRHPFIIETADATIEVTGTAFNVKAFPGRKDFELNVQSGTVEVTRKAGRDKVTVSRGEGVRLEAGTWRKKPAPADLYGLYTRKMRFKDEPVANLLRVVNRTDGKPIVLADKAIGDRKITVTFAGDTAESIAGLICLALHLQQTESNDTIYISQP